MTPEEAIDFLDDILAKAAVNRETHDKIKKALAILREVLRAAREGETE